MLELALLVAGIALQLGGVALTIVGARQVWRDIASPDDRFLAPFIRFGHWVADRARRLVGGPRTYSAHAEANLGGLTASARGYALPGPVPTGLTVDQQVGLLHEQIKDMVRSTHAAMNALEDRLEAKIKKAEKDRTELAKALDDRAEQERRRAVGGLRTEAYGFILLTLGTLVQAFGSYLGID